MMAKGHILTFFKERIRMNREDVFMWVKEQYNTEPDYPWGDENAVLRHKSNNKWYGVVLKVKEDRLGLPGVKEVDVLNVKSEPMLIGSLRMKKGFFPAYHMNKENWITILLDEKAPEEEIKNLIDMSYQMTKKTS